jgi:hypothetical protein
MSVVKLRVEAKVPSGSVVEPSPLVFVRVSDPVDGAVGSRVTNTSKNDPPMLTGAVLFKNSCVMLALIVPSIWPGTSGDGERTSAARVTTVSDPYKHGAPQAPGFPSKLTVVVPNMKDVPGAVIK